MSSAATPLALGDRPERADDPSAGDAGASLRGEDRVAGRRGLALVLELVGALTAVKLAVAALAPISFDEALYWRYSRHLAAGYIDHPFVNPLMIRVGTALLGSTPLGVRWLSVLSSLPASWAVWRAALDLFGDEALAVRALLYANLTAVFSVGAIAATSDQMVVTAACVFLACLARREATQDGRWWLAAGAALGLGLCAKYTMAFPALGAAVWALVSPGRRRRLRDWRLWAGLGGALLIFSPVLAWNAQHRWASFVYQSGRLTIFRPGLSYLADYLGALTLLATPPIFILGLLGAWRLARGDEAGRGRLLVAMILPLALYLLWHATHQRVQGNWAEPIIPALALAAAYAATAVPRGATRRPLVAACASVAVPVALGMAGVVYLGATTDLVPTGRHDLRARALGVGWTGLDGDIAATARRTQARLVLATDYTVASWGAFYAPPGLRFEQIDERIRWSNEPAPPGRLLEGAALYVCKVPCHKLSRLTRRYRTVTLDHVADRWADGRVADRYGVYLARDPTPPVLDPIAETPRADHAEEPGGSP